MSEKLCAVGQVYAGPNGKTHTVRAIGKYDVRLNALWYRTSQVERWITTGVLRLLSEGEDHAEHSGRVSE